jgi:hypothetical protein
MWPRRQGGALSSPAFLKSAAGRLLQKLTGDQMPKIPDDMSDAAVERRAITSAAELEKAKQKAAEPVAKPKPRIAKIR